MDEEKTTPVTDEDEESEWLQLVRQRYDPGGELSYEEEVTLVYLLDAPWAYMIEPRMLAYAKAHPDATAVEMRNYFREIVPPGLAPDDDGSDLPK